MTRITRSPAAKKVVAEPQAPSPSQFPVKSDPDVVRARKRLGVARERLETAVTTAKADGKVTAPERHDVQYAKAHVAVKETNLSLQKSEVRLRNVATDAYQDGKVTKSERADVERAQTRLQTLTAERRELRLQRAQLLELADGTNKGGPTDLVISSFNITGSSHTGPGSTHPELESGKKRVQYVAKLLQKHKVDVVGFQELQGDQLKELRRVTDNAYGVYPGFKLGKRESVNSIAWRKDTWALVKSDTLKIPYFNGQKREMPVVLLRNKETGQQAYFSNFHNPADTRRFKNQERHRDAATKLQIALVNRLTKKTGLPVFLTGDMNEKEEYLQHMTRNTEMHSSHKGENGKRPNKIGIDWIFGSKDVKFSDYNRDRSALVEKTTNHPMVVSKARIRRTKP